MTLHNNRVEAALAMIAEKQLNPTDVERICGINRTQIYRWKAGEVKDMRFNSFTKLADSLGYTVTYKNEKIEITPHANKKGDNNMEMEILYDQVALQKEKISRLEASHAELEDILDRYDSGSTNSINPASNHWDDLEYHYTAEVTLHFSTFGCIGRTVNKVTDLEKQSEILGYSVKEMTNLWDIGTKHKDMKDHSINNILHQSTTRELNRIGKTLPTVFNAIKDMIGNHYIPTKLMYKCKNGRYVAAIAYNKVDWKNKKVFSKVAFLVPE